MKDAVCPKCKKGHFYVTKTVFETYRVRTVKKFKGGTKNDPEFSDAVHDILPESVEVDDTSALWCDSCGQQYFGEEVTDDTSPEGIARYSDMALCPIINVITAFKLTPKQRNEILQNMIDRLETLRL